MNVNKRMVYCCVPSCGTLSWKCDASITFHPFPQHPDRAAKWVNAINAGLGKKDLWYDPGKTMVCSKHFLPSDFTGTGNDRTIARKALPSVFKPYKSKYERMAEEANRRAGIQEPTDQKKSPMILKLIKIEPESKDPVVSSVISLANDSSTSINPCNSASPDTQAIVPLPTTQDSAPEVLHLQTQVSTLQTSSYSPQIHVSDPELSISSPQASVPPSQSFAPSSQTHASTSQHVQESNSSQMDIGPVPKKHRSYQRGSPKKIDKSKDLIEIGPNTFLKINPDVIKVNKKLTPSGNTVLQFIMDQKLAKSKAGRALLPTLIKKVKTQNSTSNGNIDSSDHTMKDETGNLFSRDEPRVLGHLVDTHICQDSCKDLKDTDEDVSMDVDDLSKEPDSVNGQSQTSNVIAKAPVLVTTNMPLSHCYMEKPRYLMQLKQKSRQIASLKFKMTSLQRKLEELEDRCIVQERQLSYSFIKRLKNIRKNANKGDPGATYILEQIRCYEGHTKMRWSDSTLSQCAVWCRKAPYAYEYFKKANFFKLPCLGTVKRFMKKHPDLKFGKKTANGNDDDSSSDFDFDESEDENQDENTTNENGEQICGNVPAVQSTTNSTFLETSQNSIPTTSNNSLISQQSALNIQMTSKDNVDGTFPITVDGTNLEYQEILLPSGEIVQCYSSGICSESDLNNQYYIIPNAETTSANQEYSVVNSDSMPVILQNLEASQLPMQQDQLIFITNPADQVECPETEVTSVQ